jgi:hypothetical protein
MSYAVRCNSFRTPRIPTHLSYLITFIRLYYTHYTLSGYTLSGYTLSGYTLSGYTLSGYKAEGHQVRSGVEERAPGLAGLPHTPR